MFFHTLVGELTYFVLKEKQTVSPAIKGPQQIAHIDEESIALSFFFGSSHFV